MVYNMTQRELAIRAPQRVHGPLPEQSAFVAAAGAAIPQPRITTEMNIGRQTRATTVADRGEGSGRGRGRKRQRNPDAIAARGATTERGRGSNAGRGRGANAYHGLGPKANAMLGRGENAVPGEEQMLMQFQQEEAEICMLGEAGEEFQVQVYYYIFVHF